MVYVQSGDGEGHRLRARNKPVDLGWHNVLVTYDQEANAVSLYLDDELADRIRAPQRASRKPRASEPEQSAGIPLSYGLGPVPPVGSALRFMTFQDRP